MAGRGAILVLRGGALGDFLVTLPTLLALREAHPRHRLVLVGNRVAAELARRRGLVDEVYSQHESRWSALCLPGPLPPELADWLGAFDIVVSFWPDEDGVIASHFPLGRGRHFLSAGGPPAIHAGGRGVFAPALPAATYLARAVAPLGIVPRAAYCELRGDAIVWPTLGAPATRRPLSATPAARRSEAGGPPALPGDALLAVHPGSGSPRKNWSRDRWFEFLEQVDLPVLLIAGEVEAADWNEAALRASSLAPKLADGRLRLLECAPLETVIAELHGCSAYLGHDTGVSHLAAACGVSSLLLFGPTDPAVWAPPAPHVRVLREGSSLERLDPATVARALAELLRGLGT